MHMDKKDLILVIATFSLAAFVFDQKEADRNSRYELIKKSGSTYFINKKHGRVYMLQQHTYLNDDPWAFTEVDVLGDDWAYQQFIEKHGKKKEK